GHTYAAQLHLDPQGQLTLQQLRALHDDIALLEMLTEPQNQLCGLDVPLSLPPCLRCTQNPCPCSFNTWAQLLELPQQTFFHYRLCDVLIRKKFPHLTPKPPISNGGPVDITPLTLRWQRLNRANPQLPLHKIVEVYVSGSVQLLAEFMQLTPHKQRFPYRSSNVYRARMLHALQHTFPLTIPRPLQEPLQHNEDAFDALIAALCTCFAEQGWFYPPHTMLETTLSTTPVGTAMKPLIPTAVHTEMLQTLSKRCPCLPLLPTTAPTR
ncbi:MAG: hypothetical protein AAGJ35_11410, partial [Myxococcota bacterium]